MRLRDADMQADRVDSAIKRFHFSLKESQHLRASKSNIGKADQSRCLKMFEYVWRTQRKYGPVNSHTYFQLSTEAQ